LRNNIVIIVEARSNSKRLPKKHFFIAINKMMIDHLIERLKPSITQIIIATTTNKSDDKFEIVAKKNNINCFRGSENNVLLRVIKAASCFKANIICRVTGDSPLIDHKIVTKSINYFVKNKSNLDFLETDNNLPIGTGCSVFKVKSLIKSYNLNKSQKNLEHVTWFLKNNPKIFNLKILKFPSYKNYNKFSYTLDTKKDLKKIRKIFNFFNKNNMSTKQIVKFLNP
tara:strand:+ start:96 stop:773 length:678 start_codon:yes stop_codon:yes gene_type:complete